MEKRILIALIFGLSQCLTTFAVPQRGILHMQLHPKPDPSNKSPVHAKILKQINSVNDDGSYTFGYEADDGSFKVETRSKDGVVKGKYGFIDPNGQLKTVEYTAGEKSATGARNSREDLNMASATDSKTTVSRIPAKQQQQNDESNSSSEEEDENDVGTFNSFGSQLREREGQQEQQQYPRQVQNGQYFREVNPGSGAGAGGASAGSGEQNYRGVRPGVGIGGVQQAPQFQRQQFADERQFDARQPQQFGGGGQFGVGGQQFAPQQFGQAGGAGLGNPALAQGQGFGGGPQQQQQQRPFLFPQQGPFIGSQGPQFGGGAGGNPQFQQQQQFGPQQSFGRQPFSLGGPQTGNRFSARPGQFQNPQQFNDFNDPSSQFGGQGFGFDGGQQDFDVIQGPFGVGAGGVSALNQFGIQQQNPQLVSNQLGGFNGGVNGGAGLGVNRNPTPSGVRVNPSGDSGLRARPANVGQANSQEYVPSVELDGFSEDADQDGFVDRFPGSGENSDKKASQTEEKTPAVKTPDGQDQPLQYRPQILGPQQQRPQGVQGGVRPGFQFQQQQPQLPINQFGGPYDEDQLNQLYFQLAQQNGRFGPQQFAGSPQGAQFQGGFPNQQFLGGGNPQFFQPGFQGQQGLQGRPFLGGPQGAFPQQPSVAGLQNQGQQQQLLNSGEQGQGVRPGVSAIGQGPVSGLEQLQTTRDRTTIQPQYIPNILTGPAGQAQFAAAPNYQNGGGFGGPGGFGAYPGYNPYTLGPESAYSPFGGPFGGPQQFQQGPQFINPQLQQQQQFLGGQSPQRGPQSLLGQQPQSQSQSAQPQSQQFLGQGPQQLSLGGGGGSGDRRERDDGSGSNEDKKTN